MLLSNAAQTALPSGIRKMFAKANLYDDAINLCIGEPGFVTPRHIIQVGVDNLIKGKTKYTPNNGILPLREALAEKLQRENNIICDPKKNLIITIGATQALMLAYIALVNPGDEIIIPNPAWPNYLGQTRMVNAIPVGAVLTEKNEFKMTAETIEPLITSKTKLLIINSPANPTGATLNGKEMEDIADLVKRHRIFVISDEPYERLTYDDEKHVSLGSFPGLEEYVVTVNSFSKSYAMTGWRVGYACANEEIITNMTKLNENMIAGVNEAFQLAAVEALKAGEADIQYMRNSYDKNRKLVIDRLNRIKGITCQIPRGAFYVFPNVTQLGQKSFDVADMILEKAHVLTSPGGAFGSAGEGYLRISYANDFESLEKAMNRLEAVFGAK